MTDSVLMDINHKIRQSRSIIDDANACEIYQTNSILEVSLSRGQCINDRNGACIMCDYGIASKSKPVKEYLQEMEQALKACDDSIRCLMLCTNGSIFNENQIERPLLEGALDLASKCTIPRIELESHYLDVNCEKLSVVKEKLKNVFYPCKEFWNIATKYDIKVLYGIDTHHRGQILLWHELIELANEIIGEETIKRLCFIEK